jgi:hypothetical protein
VADNTYEVGDLVRLSAEFRIGSTLTNPTSVVVTLKDPDGTTTSPSAVNDGTGLYYADVTLNKPGVWHYRFQGTGAVQKSGRGHVNVAASEFDAVPW